MISCELCHDSSCGPWEYIEIKANSIICEECSSLEVLPMCARKGCIKLVCEDCAKRIRKERKKNVTADVRNKGYARRISRSNRRS